LGKLLQDGRELSLSSPLSKIITKLDRGWKGKCFFIFDPYQTIQETIYSHYGMDVRPCKKYDKDDEYDCPEKGMRRTNTVATFSSCPLAMPISGDFQQSKFNRLNNVLSSVLVPPETQYSFASVNLYDRSDFRGICLDVKKSQGNLLIFDRMYQPSKRIQVIRLDNLISNYAKGYKMFECGQLYGAPGFCMTK